MRNLFYLVSCGSTQDEIIPYITTNFSSVIGLYTLNQTKGRGQYGNSWDILPNQNLALSLVFQPLLNLNGVLSNYYTAILVRDYIAKLTDSEVQIKWPNDIILKGKKIGGILLEKIKKNHEDFFIIGIGLNILQESFGAVPKASSIYKQSGHKFSPKILAEDLFNLFSTSIKKTLESDKILTEYNTHLFRKGQVAVFGIQSKRQNGIIQKADADGFLWVELEQDGLQKFFHKQIEMFY